MDKMYKIESVAKEQFIWFDISVLYILFLYLHNDIKTDVRKETNEDHVFHVHEEHVLNY